MARVVLTPAAQGEFEGLPRTIQIRVYGIVHELENWPNVAGCKPLKGHLAGNWRKRTGDYRIVFTLKGDDVVVWKIGHRDRLYD